MSTESLDVFTCRQGFCCIPQRTALLLYSGILAQSTGICYLCINQQECTLFLWRTSGRYYMSLYV